MLKLLHRAAFCVAIWLLATAAQAQAQEHNAAVLEGSTGRYSFTVRLAKRPFREEGHKVKRIGEAQFEIDGKTEWRKSKVPDGSLKNWQGTDGGLPLTELSSFDVVVDGKRWPVPARLWRDCYNPNLGTDPKSPDLWAWLSKDGTQLTVKMWGGDGAGSYGVVWHLVRDGKHSRRILPAP